MATTTTSLSSSTASDPNNVQRQIEQSSRDLNQNYKQLYEQEKQSLRKVLIGNCIVCLLTKRDWESPWQTIITNAEN